MNIDIDLDEVIDNIDIRYSSAKSEYVMINGKPYVIKEALMLASNLIDKGNELLSTIKYEIERELR